MGCCRSKQNVVVGDEEMCADKTPYNIIYVLIRDGSFEQTYNNTSSSNKYYWKYSSTVNSASSAAQFKWDQDQQLVAIKAKKKNKYLQIIVDKEGVPDHPPKFKSKSKSTSGTSVATIQENQRNSVNITKFSMEDGDGGLFALSFTVKVHKSSRTVTYQHYLVPGAQYIETMDTKVPQYCFKRFTA